MGTTIKFDVFKYREELGTAYDMACYEKDVIEALSECGYTLEAEDRMRYNAILTTIGELDNAIYAANYSANQSHDVDVFLSISALRGFHEFGALDESTINARYIDHFGLDVGPLLDDLRSVPKKTSRIVH